MFDLERKKLVFKSGAIYNGQVLGDIPNGQGVIEHKDSFKYEGNWINGLPNGEGKVTLPDGTIFYGILKDGLMHGFGRLTIDGKHLAGYFKDGTISIDDFVQLDDPNSEKFVRSIYVKLKDENLHKIQKQRLADDIKKYYPTAQLQNTLKVSKTDNAISYSKQPIGEEPTVVVTVTNEGLRFIGYKNKNGYEGPFIVLKNELYKKGKYVNDKQHGKFEIFNGDTMEHVEFVNDKRHGKYTYSNLRKRYTETGKYENGKKQGKFEINEYKNTRYDYYIDGEKVSEQLYNKYNNLKTSKTSSNTSQSVKKEYVEEKTSKGVYKGFKVNGLRHDMNGQFTWNSGDKYIGPFNNGEMTGYGEYIWKSESKYEGDFVNGDFHGYGRKYNSDGNLIYEGEFRNDKKHGIGTQYSYRIEEDIYDKYERYKTVVDEMYEGEFFEDERHGEGLITRFVYDSYLYSDVERTKVIEVKYHHGEIYDKTTYTQEEYSNQKTR